MQRSWIEECLYVLPLSLFSERRFQLGIASEFFSEQKGIEQYNQRIGWSSYLMGRPM